MIFQQRHGIGHIVFCLQGSTVLSCRPGIIEQCLFKVSPAKSPVPRTYILFVCLSRERKGNSGKEEEANGCFGKDVKTFKPASLPFPYKCFQKKEKQGQTEKIHILFVEIFKDHRLEFLLVHIPDRINDPLKTKVGIPRPYINSATGPGNFHQGVFIQFCNHRISLFIF